MIVIPSINCNNEDCVRKTRDIFKNTTSKWMHIDVADGQFAPVVLCENAKEFKRVFEEDGFSANLEVHLMVKDPEPFVREWIAVNARRIIIHVESVRDIDAFRRIEEMCIASDVELGLAIKAETDNGKIEEFCEMVKFWSVLAVPIGFSGGEFNQLALNKISFIRELVPDSAIEVDGGINIETGSLARDAGADILISRSFILEKSDNPEKQYQTLVNI